MKNQQTVLNKKMGEVHKMVSKKILLAAICCTVSCMGVVLPSHAAEAQKAYRLDTVFVEGMHDPRDTLPDEYTGGQVARGARAGILGNKDFMDTPSSINAYTSKLIENSQAKTVAEVAKNDPSVRFQYPAGGLVDNYWIRNFTYNSNNMTINGLMGLAPYGSSATEMLERVEIQRGPNALMNGMNPGGEVSGNINLVTKRAGVEPIRRLSVDYTNDSQLGGHVDIGERFGNSKEWGVRFNGVYRDGHAGIDDQKQKRELASVGVDYTKGKLRASLDAYYTKDEFDGAGPAVIQFRNKIPKAPTGAGSVKGLYGQSENKAVLLHTDYTFSDHISAYAGFGKSWAEHKGFVGGANFLQTDGNTGLGILYVSNDKIYVDKTSWEGGLRGDFTTGSVKHEVVLGGSILEVETGNNNSETLMERNVSIYNPVFSGNLPSFNSATTKAQYVRLSSVALADTLKFDNDKLQVTIGARNQKILQKRYSAGKLASNYDKNRVSPMYGVVVKPWGDQVSLFASYSEGLTAGRVVPNNPLYTNAGEVFSPYVSKQTEFGVKWDNKKFANTVSFYQIKKPSDYQFIHEDGKRTFYFGGEQRNRGIEWMIFGKLSDNLRILGGINYNNAKITKGAPNATNVGKRAYGVPNWNGNVGLEWDAPWKEGLTFTTRLFYSGKFYADSANKLNVPSSTRVDLGARYHTTFGGTPVTFNAVVENLFDRNYWGAVRSDAVLATGEGRTFKLTATFDL